MNEGNSGLLSEFKIFFSVIDYSAEHAWLIGLTIRNHKDFISSTETDLSWEKKNGKKLSVYNVSAGDVI